MTLDTIEPHLPPHLSSQDQHPAKHPPQKQDGSIFNDLEVTMVHAGSLLRSPYDSSMPDVLIIL